MSGQRGEGPAYLGRTAAEWEELLATEDRLPEEVSPRSCTAGTPRAGSGSAGSAQTMSSVINCAIASVARLFQASR